MSQQVKVYRELKFADPGAVATFGTSSVPMVQTFDGNKVLQIYTTCASTNTGTMYEPQFINNILTGAGQVGGGFRINMENDVRLGAWAQALYVTRDYKTDGSGSGLQSVGCFEMLMMGSDPPSNGNYPVLELQIGMPDNHAGDNRKTYIYCSVYGNNKSNLNTYGYFFELEGMTSASNGLWYDKGGAISPGTLGEMVRVRTPGGARYIALYDSYTA